MMAVDRLLNFYPPLDVAEPRTFIAGIGTLLGQYPGDFLTGIALDPGRGIPARIKHLNNLAVLKEVLDDLYNPVAMRIRREAVLNQPRQLPAPPRSAEEQARIDQQIENWRAQQRPTPEPVFDPPPPNERVARVLADIAARRARNEGEQV